MQLNRIQVAALAIVLLLLVRAARAEDDWNVNSDTMLYTDTNNVNVVSSQLGINRALDDSGGSAQASGLVDVVTAASVDVLSHATTRFTEVRVEGDMAVSHAFGDSLPGVRYRGSVEPDYLSQGAGASWQQRLGTPDSTLAASYFFSADSVGRHGTPYDVWSRRLRSHTLDLSFSQTLGPDTVMRGVYTLTNQHGYMAKPYRYVPLFTASGLAQAQSDGVSLGLDTFNAYRLSARPAEQVPELRMRHAFDLLLMQYLGFVDASLRLEYRFYVDSWQQKAHTVDLSIKKPISEWLRINLFGRGYTQGDSYFWQRVYVVDSSQDIPRFRSVDRQLSSYWTLTGGAGMDLTFDNWQIFARVDVAQTRFNDFLFLAHRTALVADLGLVWIP